MTEKKLPRLASKFTPALVLAVESEEDLPPSLTPLAEINPNAWLCESEHGNLIEVLFTRNNELEAKVGKLPWKPLKSGKGEFIEVEKAPADFVKAIVANKGRLELKDFAYVLANNAPLVLRFPLKKGEGAPTSTPAQKPARER